MSGVMSASFMSVTELGLAPMGELLTTVEQGSLVWSMQASLHGSRERPSRAA